MRCRARVFGDDVTLDEIHPSRYFSLDPERVVQGLMAGIEPRFFKTIEDGDIIVAGRHFGMGSGRESGAWAIQLAGIKVVIAESFSRYMFRNCVNRGIWPLKVEGILDKVSEKDPLDVYPEKGSVVLEDGEELTFEPFPSRMVKIIKSNTGAEDDVR
ncbi:MAG: 3-isopropylmalate dehydratase [Candidatus Thermoplasmatota archaeon]|nr:3-isopropylmalate dehydratase [Candidatus Thermoplasmatota archaeon]